jgi:SAM-dependent methyltransferase
LRIIERLQERRYLVRQRREVASSLDEGPLQRRFAENEPLPHGYGVGLDERVVELPWALARLGGRTLDAGGSLNHRHVLTRVLPRVAELHILTAAPEARAYAELGVSYVFADFRAMPLRSDYYDTICCISSLEHVGMDNTAYGGPSREPDPDASVREVVAEFKRVLVPGGRLLVTVPFGVPEDHGWFRQFGETEIEALKAELGDGVDLTVFAYDREWQRSTPAAAAAARYGDSVVAAGAVACLDSGSAPD